MEEVEPRREQRPKQASLDGTDRELAVARLGQQLLRDETANADAVERLTRWCVRALTAPEGRRAVHGWAGFQLPQPREYHKLVPIVPLPNDPVGRVQGPPEHFSRRDGFGLTDPRMTPRAVQAEVHYCIYCHDHDGDFCSKGFPEKKGEPAKGLKTDPLGVTLTGCPLDEKISEMHALKRDGRTVAALATIMVDNPMCPATGHRICNDCMKACIYQKQDPVNIPQVETACLTDTLSMPYGFEIYALLTRWNPLAVRRPVMRPFNGKKVLVVGLGPAGFTLAQHLLNEGFGVVGIDGLKIEPLPEPWTGDLEKGVLPAAIRDYAKQMEQPLDERILRGFGGVAEYGITVRWDKNFLTVLHVILARRQLLRSYGGVRFGGTITIEDAWALGFDHVAIAAGAGKPTIVSVENNMIRGIRQASDFLMALQLTGAFKDTSLANLQIRLPVLVIGGGLTGIDTATESIAYYQVQVEKFRQRWDTLVAELGEERVRAGLDREERGIADEFLAHAQALRDERAAAAREERAPRVQELINSWGGVHLVYRRAMTESPAYRLNHEEIIKCLEEGVRFVEHMAPTVAVPDEFGAIAAMKFERQVVEDGKLVGSGEAIELPARSVLIAAGTSPNIIYEREHPGTFALDSRKQFFQAHRIVRDVAGGRKVEAVERGEGFFTSYAKDGRFVTFYGDNHPKYAGNVVKAMASARFGAHEIVGLFAEELRNLDPQGQTARDAAWARLGAHLDDELVARVRRVLRLTPTIVEVVVRAPAAARRFRPGQFYRLQTYEALSPLVDGTRLTTEGIALTGAWVDEGTGLLSMIVLEMGGSSRLVASLREGTPVVAMGPTGAPTEIPKGEDVLLVGGGLGNAVLFSIGKALRAAGCRVLYFAGYKKREDVYHEDDIEAAADQVIWSADAGDSIPARRPQDRTLVGNVVQAMLAYAKGELGERRVPMNAARRLIAIGSDRMMAAVAKARHEVLAPHLDPAHVGIGSINSPMQCMMKEVCAQCLQKHRDPVTGKETVVFSCFNQDQPLDEVDWGNLNARLRTNSVQEKLTNLWLDRLLRRQPVLVV